MGNSSCCTMSQSQPELLQPYEQVIAEVNPPTQRTNAAFQENQVFDHEEIFMIHEQKPEPQEKSSPTLNNSNSVNSYRNNDDSFTLLFTQKLHDANVEVLYEGVINRYSPGTKMMYVERWGVLTRSEFKYYKNQLAAVYGEKPLKTLPLHEICRVIKDPSDIKTEKLMLEIVPNDTNHSNILALDATPIPLASGSSRPDITLQSMNSSIFAVEKGHLLKKPTFYGDAPPPIKKSFTVSSVKTSLQPVRSEKYRKIQNKPVRQLDSGWTTRENTMYQVESRFLFLFTEEEEFNKWYAALRSALGMK